MIYKHLVIDDLREFDPPREEVTYIRTLREALDLFDHNHIHVEHLWLDFDLGNEDTSLPFVNEIASLAYNGEGQFTVDHCYIISMNPIGRERIYGLAKIFCDDVVMIDPISNGLINHKLWSDERGLSHG